MTTENEDRPRLDEYRSRENRRPETTAGFRPVADGQQPIAATGRQPVAGCHHWRIEETQAVLFDLDGTLWIDGTVYDGIGSAVARLLEMGLRVVVVSNNSHMSGRRVAEGLHHAGIGGASRVVTVTDVAGGFLATELNVASVRVFGTGDLVASCASAGLRVVDAYDTARADAILLGLSDDFAYATIRRVADCLGNGERLVVTNDDPFRPGVGTRRTPETGALLAAVRTVRPVEATVIGKPNRRLFSAALELAEADPAGSVVVGDGLTTDIAGASRLGMRSVWISHGSTPADGPTPTWTFENPSAFADYVKGYVTGCVAGYVAGSAGDAAAAVPRQSTWDASVR